MPCSAQGWLCTDSASEICLSLNPPEPTDTSDVHRLKQVEGKADGKAGYDCTVKDGRIGAS